MTAARIKARIYKDPEPVNEGWPWYFNVDAYLPGEPEPAVIDFGSVPTHAEALSIVLYVLTHRDEYDNPDLVHTAGS
jgi:hypothetical protein